MSLYHIFLWLNSQNQKHHQVFAEVSLLSQLPLLRSRYQTQRERLLDRIEKEKDSDIKAELREGNVIKDYC